MELFEGFVSFNVSYSGLYKRKGHGNGEKIKFAFWGVGTRRDKAGKEIGLRPMTPVSISSITDDYVEAIVPANNPANEAVQRNQPEASSSPRFMGNFDAYLMGLDDDLYEAYLPGGSLMPRFEEVYNAIIETNTKHAAQLYHGTPVRSDDDYDDLDDNELNDEDSKGQMKGSAIADPFVEQPYNMVITSIKVEDPLAFTDDELWQFPTRDVDPPGPGMTAQLTLASGGHHNVVAGATG